MHQEAHPPGVDVGSRIYNRLVLFIYDLWIIWFANRFLWKCSTYGVQLPLFRAALGKTHMDIGVGTGYIPSKAVAGSACEDMTLVDLNPNCLSITKARIESINASVRARTLVADVMKPIPLSKSDKFDSISLSYLLHCLPSPPEQKISIFDHLKHHLVDEGVLIGWTVLGREAPMNWVAKMVMTVLNDKRIFDNWNDNAETFTQGLQRNFEDVEVWTVGRTFVFKARKPLNS